MSYQQRWEDQDQSGFKRGNPVLPEGLTMITGHILPKILDPFHLISSVFDQLQDLVKCFYRQKQGQTESSVDSKQISN